MKLQRLLVFLLAFCLAGCSLPETAQPSVPTQPPVTVPAPSETTPSPETVYVPDDDDFVPVKAYIPDIFVDLRYATKNNFTNQIIYDFADAYLRYGTVKKLIAVQEELTQQGLRLKIWDGFRPVAAQFKLWEVCPDPTYVANPNTGFSSHSRGNTVDVTLVNADGTELNMPTGFDDFSKLADRDYSDCTEEAARNAQLLENVMIKHGFQPYSGEWWHFTDTESYPVEKLLEPISAALYFADCQEYISLRAKPNTSAAVITKVPAGEQFQVVARCGEFALIAYQGLYGYVLSRYMQPVN